MEYNNYFKSVENRKAAATFYDVLNNWHVILAYILTFVFCVSLTSFLKEISYSRNDKELLSENSTGLLLYYYKLL